jgi:hypothetical protein
MQLLPILSSLSILSWSFIFFSLICLVSLEGIVQIGGHLAGTAQKCLRAVDFCVRDIRFSLLEFVWRALCSCLVINTEFCHVSKNSECWKFKDISLKFLEIKNSIPRSNLRKAIFKHSVVFAYSFATSI